MKQDLIRLGKLFSITKKLSIIYIFSTLIVASRNFIISYVTIYIEQTVFKYMVNDISIKFGEVALKLFLIILMFVFYDGAGTYIQQTTIQKMNNKIRNAMLFSILHAKLKEIDQFGNRGDLLIRIEQDIQSATSIYSFALLLPLMYIISGIGSSIIIGRINLFICILIYIIGFLILFVQIWCGKRERILKNKAQQAIAEGANVYNISLSGLEQIKMSNMTEYANEVHEKALNEFLNIYKKLSGLSSIKNGSVQIGSWFGSIGVTIICIILYKYNYIALEAVISIFNMSILIINMITSFGYAFSNMQSSLVGIDRIDQVLNIEKETENGIECSNDLFKNDITILDVTCNISKDIVIRIPDFIIRHNQITGLSGKSGVGKSTFLKQMCCLYDYDGNIRIGHLELSDINKSIVRNNILLVNQDNLIICGTVRENILLGNDMSIDDKYIIDMLNDLTDNTLLSSLENGLDTQLIEGGKNLSGGQIKIIALARALFRNANIILFDEIFAGVDKDNIHRICNYLTKMKVKKTFLIVSHDGDVLDYCDNVIVLNNTM